jgi:hypothetical protein
VRACVRACRKWGAKGGRVCACRMWVRSGCVRNAGAKGGRVGGRARVECRGEGIGVGRRRGVVMDIEGESRRQVVSENEDKI